MKQIVTVFLLIWVLPALQAQSGLFQTSSYYPQINDAEKVLSGDINGDGFADLLVQTAHKQSILIYINDQSGQFYLAEKQLNAEAVQATLLEDFDNDGDLDIRTSSVIGGFNNIDAIHSNDGSGNFEITSSQEFNDQNLSSTVELLAGDLNNNGNIDVLRVVKLSQNQLFTIYINNVEAQAEERPIENLYNPRFADFNNDGFLDIWSLGIDLTIYLNDGQGAFSDELKVEVAQSFVGLNNSNTLLADIDNDGDMDIQTFSDDFALPRYINNGDGTFENNGLVGYLNGGPDDQVGVFLDADNDQDLDLWFADNSGNTSEIAVTAASGAIDWNADWVELDERNVDVLLADDFDNDGDADVITFGTKGLYLWEQKSANEFELSEQSAANQLWGVSQSIALADMNNDGTLDMVSTGSGGVQVASGNGRGGFAVLNNQYSQKIRYSHVVDLNNDGFSDLVVTKDGRSVDVLINNQNNGFQTIPLAIELQSAIAYKILSNDFDQDGDEDFLVQELTGPIHVFSNEGNNQFTESQVISGSFRSFELVDLNQTGEVVLIAQDVSFVTGGGVFEYEFNGNSFQFSRSVFVEFLFFRDLVFIDADDDGDLDILTNKFVDQDTFVLVLNQASSFEVGQLEFAGGRPSLAADMNQDGLMDIVNSAGQIYLKTGDTYESSDGADVLYGFNPFVVGDFDSDSDLDMIVENQFTGLTVLMNTSVDIDFGGSWYNVGESGHGIQVDQIISNGRPAVLVSWYVYENGRQIWITGSGEIDGISSTIEAYTTYGPEFGDLYDVDDLSREPWGSLKLTYLEQNKMKFEWDGGISDSGVGEIDFVRFAAIRSVNQTIGGLDSCHSGSWYNPATSGQGVMSQIININGVNSMLLTWYTYLNGEQYWLSGTGPITGNTAELTVIATKGADFPPDFVADDVERFLWGDITFELVSDQQAMLSWDPVIADFSAGQMSVQRLTVPDKYLCH